MHSVPIDIFFSCSFKDVDQEVNQFFLAICRALSLKPTNVSTGSPRVPPMEAKVQIERAQAVIAICPKRTEMADGGYVMPPAVRDEIAIAFGTDTPLLMVIEDGVDFSGFQTNFGTYLPFKRSDMFSPEFLEKAIDAVHALKLFALGPYQGGGLGIQESHADFINHLVELRPTPTGLTWQYSTIKRLVYSQSSRRSFPVGLWATVPVQTGQEADNMKWTLTQRSASRNIKLEQIIEKHTPSCIEARIKLNPPAEEGNSIEYVTTAESPYINPIWLEDLAKDASPIHLNDSSYSCADGLMFIHRTKKAVLEFRFSSEAGLSRSDIRPFVGSYSAAMDYEVESELSRANVRTEDFGGTLSVRMEIDSPLPGHMYGIAWNPKPTPSHLKSTRNYANSTSSSDQTDLLIADSSR